MDVIPEALFLEIFSFLSIHEVFLSISLVNKIFNSITKIDYFLETLVKITFRLCIPNKISSARSLAILKDSIK